MSPWQGTADGTVPPIPPPVAIGQSRPKTAAADPHEEPPAVRDGFHGLPVTPCTRVTLTLRPPNSDAAVCPNKFAPADRNRVTIVESCCATRSANTSDAS